MKPSIKALPAFAGAILATLVAASPVFSVTLSLVTNRAEFPSDDQLDWSSLGPIVPPQPFKVLSPFIPTNSEGGLPVNVSVPPPGSPGITPPLVFQTSATGIPTNFAPGDFVLFTGLLPGQFPAPGNPGPLSLIFATPIAGAGTQIAVDDTLQFIASVSAYDSNNTLLGTFSAPGTSSLALDNSALFLGVLSETANISRLEFSSSVSNRAIGINTVSIATTAVPEPSSTVALILTGFGLGVAKKWRASREKESL